MTISVRMTKNYPNWQGRFKDNFYFLNIVLAFIGDIARGQEPEDLEIG